MEYLQRIARTRRQLIADVEGSASSRRARASSSVRASLGSGVRAGGAVRSWDVD